MLKRGAAGRRARGDRDSLRQGHRRRRPRRSDRRALARRATSSTTPSLCLDGGGIAGRTFKYDLPNYGVFDEKRVFAAGPLPGPFNVRGVRVGVPICEDIWTPEVARMPCARRARKSCWCPTARRSKPARKMCALNLVAARVTETRLPLIYLNQVGGQDELVFDGALVRASTPTVQAGPGHAVLGRKRRRSRDWSRHGGKWVCAPGDTARRRRSARSSVYHAMMLGLRDYVNKNRFPGVVLGLSGGIDSALSAAVAVDALGADRVRCVMLPSRYTVAGQPRRRRRNARACSAFATTPSRSSARWTAFGDTLAPVFAGKRRRHHRGEHPVARPRRSS